jgi:hypothetical protein
MGGQLYLTNSIDNKLEALAKTHKVLKEAPENTLLLLATCNEEQVKQCVNIVRTSRIEGGTKIEERGM